MSEPEEHRERPEAVRLEDPLVGVPASGQDHQELCPDPLPRNPRPEGTCCHSARHDEDGGPIRRGGYEVEVHVHLLRPLLVEDQPLAAPVRCASIASTSTGSTALWRTVFGSLPCSISTVF